MHSDQTFEQSQLQHSLERLLSERYGFNARRAIAAEPCGWSRPAWQRLADLGLAALLVPQAHGGFGGTARDTAAVCVAVGRSLVLEPWLGSAVLATTALALSGDAGGCAEALSQAAVGELVLAYAHEEAGSDGLGLWVETRAVEQQAGVWRLYGCKCNVLHGADAGQLVVSARHAGAPGEAGGLGLYLVEGAAAGLQRAPTRLLDDTPAASVVMRGVEARSLGAGAAATIEAVRRAGVASACGQMSGASEAAFAMTVGYVNTRQQFGTAIGSNQAVRHRVAEMLMALETCRSAAAMASAAAALPATDPAAGQELLRAKFLAGRHGRFVCQQAVQLHGGIGMTVEYPVGHFLRRLVVLDQLFGEERMQAVQLGQVLAAG